MGSLILPPGAASNADKDQFDKEVFNLSNILGATIARFDPDPRVVRAALMRITAAQVLSDWIESGGREKDFRVKAAASLELRQAFDEALALYNKVAPANDGDE